MKLRRPDPSEAEALVDLWYHGWCDAHAALTPRPVAAHRTRPAFADRLRRKWPKVLVIGLVGAPTGFAVIDGDTVDQFYLARAARGTGLARPFLMAVEDRLRAAGIGTGRLICTLGNDRAAGSTKRPAGIAARPATGRSKPRRERSRSLPGRSRNRSDRWKPRRERATSCP